MRSRFFLIFLILIFFGCDPDGTGCGGSNTNTGTSTDTNTSSSGNSGLGAVQFSQKMGAGWNLGNSLEAMGPGNETIWGNPVVTQQLISSVKAAGFKTIRIPVAWSVFSNASNYTIDPAWLNRVEEVVNYALKADMYVIMNEHWDGGWLNHPFYANQQSLNNRLSIMWTQIAKRFRDYDHRLLFAGTNEVLNEGDYGAPTKEMVEVQNSFNQTFVNAVRATGGKNADRYLVAQAFNTNIDHAVNFFVLPKDTISNRLFVEVHYYDPYNFTLNADNVTTEWPSKSETWANEAWVDGQMRKMKTNFVDKGVAVILGEYCATS
jgi:endoglucanase